MATPPTCGTPGRDAHGPFAAERGREHHLAEALGPLPQLVKGELLPEAHRQRLLLVSAWLLLLGHADLTVNRVVLFGHRAEYHEARALHAVVLDFGMRPACVDLTMAGWWPTLQVWQVPLCARPRLREGVAHLVRSQRRSTPRWRDYRLELPVERAACLPTAIGATCAHALVAVERGPRGGVWDLRDAHLLAHAHLLLEAREHGEIPPLRPRIQLHLHLIGLAHSGSLSGQHGRCALLCRQGRLGRASGLIPLDIKRLRALGGRLRGLLRGGCGGRVPARRLADGAPVRPCRQERVPILTLIDELSVGTLGVERLGVLQRGEVVEAAAAEH
mmetsp:Transcript_12837/g.32520  ORF Transcript_12837/g.32520 Transcript_12837/m.32520 type:complete len:331 (-) Transcript_12837:310-1302(-)